MMSRLYSFLPTLVLLCCATCSARIIQKEYFSNELNEKNNFSLEEYFEGTFISASFNGSWLSDSTFWYKDKNSDILIYDVKSRNSTVLLKGDALADYVGATITVSDDEQYVLIAYNTTSVFRHSTTSIYTIYNLNDKGFYHVNNQMAIQFAALAPAGHGLAYVYKNNIYYVSDVAKINEPEQVTTEGVEGIIYCGVPDWVYEEEVLGSGSALWFSPNGRRIVYAQFDDQLVEDFHYILYGNPGSVEDLYPTLVTIKYPKVGTPNPIVNTFVYDIDSKSTTKLQLPDKIHNDVDNNDYVLYDVSWVSDSEIGMISTNRVQNESIVLRCTAEDGTCSEEVSHRQSNGWLISLIPKYSKDGSRILEILPQPVEDDTYNHLVITDLSSGQSERLTYGNRVVSQIYSWDEDSGKIYYGGSVNGTPSKEQIYAYSTTDKVDTCLSCNYVEDVPCNYTRAYFSPENSYYVQTCTGPNPNYIVVRSTTDENDFIIWEDNQAIKDKLETKNLPRIKTLNIPIDANFNAEVKLLLPPNLDETSTKKYPTLVEVYGGPESNAISEANSFHGFQNYLVTEKEYIYVYINGRGTSRSGNNKMFQVYRNLATVEIEDQIAAIKHLQDNLPYVDREKTGIWGWSYGGFATGWTLVKDTENRFKCGLSVAPVTDFIYYDTIYTERYMGLLSDNELGYNNTDLSRNVEALRGKKYFLIHGNADDNVHYQQSMALSKALERADILFRQQSYPDENHSLGYVQKHLYHTMDKFWTECFCNDNPERIGNFENRQYIETRIPIYHITTLLFH